MRVYLEMTAMLTSKSAKLLGLALLVAWLSLFYLLIPLPGQRFMQLSEKEATQLIDREMKSTGLARADVERAIKLKQKRDREAVWVQWSLVALLVVVGIAASVAAVRNVKDWPYYVSITSLLYLIGWGLSLAGAQAPPHASLLDTYISGLLNSLLADSSASLLVFLHKDLVLPLFHLFVVTYLPYRRYQLGSPVTHG